MKQIYLNYIATKKDAKRISYEDLVASTNMSKSKLQRIFTGQVDVTVDDLEIIVEKGLKEKIRDLYALMGEQEFKESADNEFKGTQQLIDEFAAEKAQIRQEYTERLKQAEQELANAQAAFGAALNQLEEGYKKSTEYLTGLVARSEKYNETLTARAVKAEDAAAAAQKRADLAEERVEHIDKRRHNVFWGMLVVVIILLALLSLAVILDLPMLGMGNA